MNKIYKFAALLSVCMAAVAGCTPELNTDQYSDDSVTFAAFAPNPVARGGALRITGSNLQRVTEVNIPGVEPITNIEVVSEGKLSEIRVIVPVDGPEIGKISIIAEGRKYESFGELTYSEPIFFTDFSPKNAMPGQEITLKGDYLNNIKVIQFEGGAVVKEFVSQSRYELKVIVPSNAITGKVIIGDVDEDNNPDGAVSNLFYSEDELVIGKPTVTSAKRGELKAGDEVTVKGQYLDMIKSLSFDGVDADFTVAEDGKSLTAALPETAGDGEIVLVSYAGDEFGAGDYTTRVPSDLAISPKTVYKAGLEAVVTGKDLDLVTGADLSGTALEFTYADGNIAFAIPEKAVDGAVTFALANGKTVSTDAIGLVRPAITSMTPAELYAGEQDIVVIGTDLDLVATVTLGGKPAEFICDDENTLTVVTSLTSVTGKVALTLANGVTVTSEDEITVKYRSKVIVTGMPASEHIGQEVVLTGSNFALVENIFIGEAKVTKYSLRTDTEVRFLMPWNKAGMYNITFNLFDGDVETVATPIEVGLELDIKTIWEGSSYVTWNGGAVADLSWGRYDWSAVKPGTVLTAYFEVVDEGAAIRFGNGSWSALPTTKTFSNSDGEGNLAVGKDVTFTAVKLTAQDLTELQTNGGLVVCGTGYKISSITLTTEISQETTVWEGNLTITWGVGGRVIIPASAFEGRAAGSQINFYFDQIDSTWGQAQINYADWTGLTFEEIGGNTLVPTDLFGWEFDSRCVTCVLTQEILDNILAKRRNCDDESAVDCGIIIQGSDIIFTEVTIK